MTAAAVKNCGSCRWWDELDGQRRHGFCEAAIPESVRWLIDQRFIMRATEGTTCPCYAPREGGEETRS